MTVSILQQLATMPNGQTGIALSIDELGGYLRAQLLTPAEQARNDRHALRDEMYADGGDDHMSAIVGQVFEAQQVIDKRRQMIPHAKFGNCLKRIVAEMSTVYAEPARRTVGGGDANQARYVALCDAMDLDGQMDVVNQMLNLHRALFVAPRVRRGADGTATMVLDIATPATVRLLMSPLDRTQILGVLVRVDMPMVRSMWTAKPAWQLWTDHETMFLDDRLNPIPGTVEAHDLGMNRWIALSYRSTATPGFWPGREGDDLIAARVTEWLTNILLIKETKSNTKQPIVSGDTTSMARAQAADSELPIEAPEGVSVSTVDMGTDPGQFIKTSDYALERTGNGYGLSMGALTHQGVQSAEARELMLAPVRERRRKQIKIFRRFEKQLAVVMAAVAAKYAPDLAFDPSEWRIDFGETQVLLSKQERLAIYDTERKAFLTNPLAFMRQENPDLSDEQAMAQLVENVRVQTLCEVLTYPLRASSGALGGAAARADGAPTGGRPPNDPHDETDNEAGDTPHTEATSAA